MIWQEHPPTIVMVTNLKEDKKVKCHQYWPDSGSQSFGPFLVTITDQQVFADYTIRLLQIEVKDSTRIPQQLISIQSLCHSYQEAHSTPT